MKSLHDYFKIIRNFYLPTEPNKKFPKINVTWSGAAYADPEDILKSGNARKQIEELKKTKIARDIKKEAREKEKSVSDDPTPQLS